MSEARSHRLKSDLGDAPSGCAHNCTLARSFEPKCWDACGADQRDRRRCGLLAAGDRIRRQSGSDMVTSRRAVGAGRSACRSARETAAGAFAGRAMARRRRSGIILVRTYPRIADRASLLRDGVAAVGFNMMREFVRPAGPSAVVAQASRRYATLSALLSRPGSMPSSGARVFRTASSTVQCPAPIPASARSWRNRSRTIGRSLCPMTPTRSFEPCAPASGWRSHTGGGGAPARDASAHSIGACKRRARRFANCATRRRSRSPCNCCKARASASTKSPCRRLQRGSPIPLAPCGVLADTLAFAPALQRAQADARRWRRSWPSAWWSTWSGGVCRHEGTADRRWRRDRPRA